MRAAVERLCRRKRLVLAVAAANIPTKCAIMVVVKPTLAVDIAASANDADIESDRNKLEVVWILGATHGLEGQLAQEGLFEDSQQK